MSVATGGRLTGCASSPTSCRPSEVTSVMCSRRAGSTVLAVISVIGSSPVRLQARAGAARSSLPACVVPVPSLVRAGSVGGPDHDVRRAGPEFLIAAGATVGLGRGGPWHLAHHPVAVRPLLRLRRAKPRCSPRRCLRCRSRPAGAAGLARRLRRQPPRLPWAHQHRLQAVSGRCRRRGPAPGRGGCARCCGTRSRLRRARPAAAAARTTDSHRRYAWPRRPASTAAAPAASSSWNGPCGYPQPSIMAVSTSSGRGVAVLDHPDRVGQVRVQQRADQEAWPVWRAHDGEPELGASAAPAATAASELRLVWISSARLPGGEAAGQVQADRLLRPPGRERRGQHGLPGSRGDQDQLGGMRGVPGDVDACARERGRKLGFGIVARPDQRDGVRSTRAYPVPA